MRRVLSILLAGMVPALSACDAPAASVEAPVQGRAAAIEALFDEDAVGETRALLIMHDGQVVTERYGPGYGPQTRFTGWSLSKTVTAVMIGMMVDDGKFALEDRAPVPQWQGDTRKRITMRDLLQMHSGLAHVEDGEAIDASDTIRMLYRDGRDDAAAFAAAQVQKRRHGIAFNYTTPGTVLLADIATRALTASPDPQTRREAMATYLQTRLFGPVGMDNTFAEYDRAGTLLGGSSIHAGARDWARFGELLRHDGKVDGRQIVSADWVEFMRTPSPDEPAHGAHLWLNRDRESTRNPILFPERGPPDLVAALGHRGQFILVSPSQGLTIVRLGQTQSEQMPELFARLGDLTAQFDRNQ